MTPSDFLNKLKIDLNLVQDDDKYRGEIEDSNTFSKIYSILDKSDLVDLREDSVLITEHITELIYDGDEFTINLTGNFDTDNYFMTVAGVE